MSAGCAIPAKAGIDPEEPGFPRSRERRTLTALIFTSARAVLPTSRGLDGEQLLAVFDRLAVLGKHLDDFAGDVGFDLVHQFHRLDDAEDLALFHPVAGGNERRRLGG